MFVGGGGISGEGEVILSGLIIPKINPVRRLMMCSCLNHNHFKILSY